MRFIRPTHNLPSLDEKLRQAHAQRPFTFAIDLTRGKLSQRLESVQADVPIWDTFSIGRIRQATKLGLPTSGHLISHSPEEIRAETEGQDVGHVLILDDTSFSGGTNLIVQDLVTQAFPDREMQFSHGFLILNRGQLGPAPGASERLHASGSRAIGGMEMVTPRDDGWHFFDMVKQSELPAHLPAVMGLARLLAEPGGEQSAEAFLADEQTLQLVFPDTITGDELRDKHKIGRFVTTGKINSDLHVRNPQPLPNIIAERQLLPPDQWRQGEAATLELLQEIGELIEMSGDDA